MRVQWLKPANTKQELGAARVQLFTELWGACKHFKRCREVVEPLRCLLFTSERTHTHTRTQHAHMHQECHPSAKQQMLWAETVLWRHTNTHTHNRHTHTHTHTREYKTTATPQRRKGKHAWSCANSCSRILCEYGIDLFHQWGDIFKHPLHPPRVTQLTPEQQTNFKNVYKTKKTTLKKIMGTTETCL